MRNTSRRGVHLGGQLIIGVGGTGQRIVSQLKRRASHSLPGSLQSRTKYLAIDCDVLLAGSELGAEEFLHLTVTDTQALIQAQSVELQDWLDIDHLPLSQLRSINKGAGQVRAFGRLALFANLDVVLARIRMCLVELTHSAAPEDLSQPRASIVFCGSTAGGTGSGVLLDLAAAVRSIPEAKSFSSVGYVLLPGAFIGKPLTHNVEENTYAFLKELDYLQFCEPDGTGVVPSESLHIQVGRHKYSLAHPFDRVSLFDDCSLEDLTFGLDSLIEAAVSAIVLERDSIEGWKAANEWLFLRDKNFPMVMFPHPRYSPYWTFGSWPLEGIPSTDTEGDALRALERALTLSSPLLQYDGGGYASNVSYVFGPRRISDACDGFVDRTMIQRIESSAPAHFLQFMGPLELARLRSLPLWRNEYHEYQSSETDRWALHLDKRWERCLPDIG